MQPRRKTKKQEAAELGQPRGRTGASVLPEVNAGRAMREVQAPADDETAAAEKTKRRNAANAARRRRGKGTEKTADSTPRSPRNSQQSSTPRSPGRRLQSRDGEVRKEQVAQENSTKRKNLEQTRTAPAATTKQGQKKQDAREGRAKRIKEREGMRLAQEEGEEGRSRPTLLGDDVQAAPRKENCAQQWTKKTDAEINEEITRFVQYGRTDKQYTDYKIKKKELPPLSCIEERNTEIKRLHDLYYNKDVEEGFEKGVREGGKYTILDDLKQKYPKKEDLGIQLGNRWGKQEAEAEEALKKKRQTQAATTIQAAQRGRASRSKEEEQGKFETDLQLKFQNGVGETIEKKKNIVKGMKNIYEDIKMQEEIDKLYERWNELEDRQTESATKIQAVRRGKMARKMAREKSLKRTNVVKKEKEAAAEQIRKKEAAAAAAAAARYLTFDPGKCIARIRSPR